MDLQRGGVIISIRIQDIEVCLWVVLGIVVPAPGSSFGLRPLRLPLRTRPSGLASSVNRSYVLYGNNIALQFKEFHRPVRCAVYINKKIKGDTP